jgi:hypothetical protein
MHRHTAGTTYPSEDSPDHTYLLSPTCHDQLYLFPLRTGAVAQPTRPTILAGRYAHSSDSIEECPRDGTYSSWSAPVRGRSETFLSGLAEFRA